MRFKNKILNAMLLWAFCLTWVVPSRSWGQVIVQGPVKIINAVTLTYGSPQITLVAHTCQFCSGYSSRTSPNINTTGASLLAAACSDGSASPPPPTDAAGNWNSAPTAFYIANSGGTAGTQIAFFATASPITSATENFTIGESGENCVEIALSGTKTSSETDSSIEAYFNTATNVTSWSIGPETPAQSGEFIWAVLLYSSTSNTITPTLVSALDASTAFSPFMNDYDYTTPSTSAITPSWSISNTGDNGTAGMVGFLHP